MIYLSNPTIDIDFNLLEFSPVPERDFGYIEEVDMKERNYHNLPPLNQSEENLNLNTDKTTLNLTINEAKVELSNHYKILPENIEIILRR